MRAVRTLKRLQPCKRALVHIIRFVRSRLDVLAKPAQTPTSFLARHQTPSKPVMNPEMDEDGMHIYTIQAWRYQDGWGQQRATYTPQDMMRCPSVSDSRT